MHPAEQPADTKRGYDGRIRLRFNLVAQLFFERACVLSNSIGSSAVQILSCPCGPIDCALSFGFCVAGSTADALLKFASDVSDGPFHSIFIHD
jgi:hypothetical protein